MTTYTDPETLQVINLESVDKMVARYRSAPTEAQKKALARQLTIYGISLARIRSEYRKRLEAGEAILRSHPDDDREARWREWMQDYETVSDCLSQIEHGVLRNRWDLVSARHDMTAESEAA